MQGSVCSIVLNEFTNDSRVLKEAVSLKNAGYKVLVLAMHAHGLQTHEVVAGVPVHRIRLWTRGWSKRKPVQIIKYLEFVLKALFLSRRFDILHCNDLNALPVGVLGKALHFGRRKVVYDAHEFEIDCAGPVSRRSIRRLARFEGSLIHYADAVITVSHSIAKAYRRLYRIPMPELVLNCPPYRADSGRYDKFREELGIRADQTIFLYQGALAPGRGIDKFLDVFARMSGDSAVIVFMGYGPLSDLVRRAAATNTNIFFRSAVPSHVLLDYTASADVGLVYIENTCLSYEWCLPNKFFEYLMAGLTILCSNLVEPNQIMRSFNLGGDERQGGVEALPARISALASHSRATITEDWERCRRAYAWEQQELRLLSVYSKLVEHNKTLTR